MKTVRVMHSDSGNMLNLSGFEFGDYVRVSSNNSGFEEIRRPVLGRTIAFSGIPSGVYKVERFSNGEVASSEMIRVDDKKNQSLDLGDREYVIREAKPLPMPKPIPQPFPTFELLIFGAAVVGAGVFAVKALK